MMATEATNENLVEASSATPQLTTTNSLSQDVEATDASSVNGDLGSDGSKPYVEGIDSSINSADVSVNGGSDSEATRAEKGTGDGQSHTRNSSTIRKPISFKAVSVNKTFLAAKGAISTTTSKSADKGAASSASSPSSSATLSARPRLVAKTGSGLRDSAPRSSTTASGVSGSAPDANAVWNKNRPAPPPEQKRITDEELKQQYGIHLATRLQSDIPGSTWADIDDEDDDWAPESIEWTDGTKVSLPSAEETAQALAKAAAPPIIQDMPKVELVKPKSPAPPSNPAILKPSSLSGGIGKGLILKGVSEKPTLVAKPPGPPTPVKSPWASLPPVDKVAPVAQEASQSAQPQHSRFSQRDPHGFDAMPPIPAKEIAADDFSRTWRGENSNSSRELYNSQSGRYEPVNDVRRGSRNEANSRQPALLQRPSQDQGPAEPSAAFQTHRAGGPEGSFGRRRASSNLSGGSGNYGRRPSRGLDMPQPQDMVAGRRGSAVAVGDEIASPRTFSPGGPPKPRANAQQPHASPAISHSLPATTQIQPSMINPVEEDLELQKKIMRESRELARKRKQDEEAKDEAARKERIRLKLEAMGPAPESKKAKKEMSKDDKAAPVKIQARESVPASKSPPKPPVPEAAGEVKQYGMMKVHHAEPVASAVAPRDAETKSGVHEDNINGFHADHSHDRQHQASTWQGNANTPEGFTSWVSATSVAPAQKGNVWGAPNSNKTLGNGTFNPELSRIPDMQGSQQMAASNPGPIGPPGNSRGPSGSYQSRNRDQYAQRPGPIGPPRGIAAWANLPEQLARDDALTAEEQGRRDVAGRERPLAPSAEPPATVFKDKWRQVELAEDGSRTGILATSERLTDGMPVSAAAAWSSLPPNLEQAEHARNEQLGQGQSHGVTVPYGIDPRIGAREAWRQSDKVGSQMVNTMATNTTSPPVRGSRFFPTRDVRLEDPYISFTRPGSPSPPPPTETGHPAYDSDVRYPRVSLPPQKAVVRLPPPQALAPIAPPKPLSFAAAAATPIALPAPLPPPQPLRQQEFTKTRGGQQMLGQSQGEWQDRINSLIGRKPSPPKTHALAVDSSSKHAFELPAPYPAATVSLPITGALAISDNDISFETKPLAEECFEEQEMGSLPPIRFPHKAPEAAWSLAPTPPKMPKKFVFSDATTIEELKATSQPHAVTINLSGMDKALTIPLKVEARQRSNPRRAGARGGGSRHTSGTHLRGGRQRDPSNNFSPPQMDSPSPTSNAPRGGRGRGGAYGSNWSQRHSSSSNTAINV